MNLMIESKRDYVSDPHDTSQQQQQVKPLLGETDLARLHSNHRGNRSRHPPGKSLVKEVSPCLNVRFNFSCDDNSLSQLLIKEPFRVFNFFPANFQSFPPRPFRLQVQGSWRLTGILHPGKRRARQKAPRFQCVFCVRPATSTSSRSLTPPIQPHFLRHRPRIHNRELRLSALLRFRGRFPSLNPANDDAFPSPSRPLN